MIHIKNKNSYNGINLIIKKIHDNSIILEDKRIWNNTNI